MPESIAPKANRNPSLAISTSFRTASKIGANSQNFSTPLGVLVTNVRR